MRLRNWLLNFKKWKRKILQFMNLTEDITSKNQSSDCHIEQKKYYNSIYDCPIRNYFKTIETSDSRYLYIQSNYENLKGKRLDNIFNKIFWEYQEESGLDDDFKMSIEYKAKIADLQLQEAITKKSLKPKISYYKSLLEGLRGKKESQGLSKRLAILRKWYGQPIPYTTTIFEYIGIEKLYIEHAKQSTINK